MHFAGRSNQPNEIEVIVSIILNFLRFTKEPLLTKDQMFDILETLFKLLHKADEEIKTEILQGLYHLSRPVLEFGEVFQKITM